MPDIDLDRVTEARRVAVRDGEGQPWRWFGPAVVWTLRNWRSDIPMAVLEDICVEAAFRHPTQHCRVMQAPSVEVLEQVDMSTLP